MKRFTLALIALVLLVTAGAWAQTAWNQLGPDHKFVEGSGKVLLSDSPESSVKMRIDCFLTSADGGFYAAGWSYIGGVWTHVWPSTTTGAQADSMAYVPADLVLPVKFKFDALVIQGETSTEDVHIYIYK